MDDIDYIILEKENRQLKEEYSALQQAFYDLFEENKKLKYIVETSKNAFNKISDETNNSDRYIRDIFSTR